MSHAGRFFGLLATMMVFATLGSVAHAAQPGNDALPIAVLAVKSDDALDQAEALTTALRSAVLHAKGWSLGETNQSLEFLALKMKCNDPIDAPCEARIGDVIEADRFIWSVINLDQSKANVVGTVNLFVRGKGTNSTPIVFAASMADAAELDKVAERVLDKVTGGPPHGGIKVVAGGIAGQLYIDGTPQGALPSEGGTVQMPAGDHTVTVKAPGYQDASTQVHVQALATVEAILAMTPVAQEAPLDGRMLGGFASLGVGVALGSVGLWAALDVNSVRNHEGYQTYRSKLTSNDNACEVAEQPGGLSAITKDTIGAATDEEVRELCGKAGRAELIQAVAFPVAAVALGVGGYLLGTSSLGRGGDDSPSAWRIVPMIGTTQQSLAVHYQF